MQPFALYVHVPFCLSKCKYCDFYSVCVKDFPKREYFDALKKELFFRAKSDIWKNKKISSIYFGGGTPSLIEPIFYKDFLHSVKEYFDFEDNIEITLEANPKTLSFENLIEYNELRINRISLGAQSFNDDILKFLGRTHTALDTLESVELIKRAGFKNISLDLIFSIPTQTLNDIKHDLEIIKALNIPHISYYSLIIEEKTLFFKLREQGKLREVSDDMFLKMDKEISTSLKDLGYTRYEISNFAKNGFTSKHNLAYWNSTDFLGLGASAYSGYFKYGENKIVIGNVRYANKKSFKDYIELVKREDFNNLNSYYEENDLKTSMFEYIMMGLRQQSGISFKDFKEKFNKNFLAIYGNVVLKLEKDNLINVNANGISIKNDKILISNNIIQEFL